MTAHAGGLAVLARLRAERPVPSPYERCEMCAAPIAVGHQHVVDIARRALLCACRPCHLLFSGENDILAYRAVPGRFLRVDLPAPVWESLELPVGTAFVLLNSTLGRPVAVYPGPAGATESELPLDAWQQVAAVAGVAELLPDVEALLVRATGGRVEAYLVPIDVCYELVGHLRQLWRGFDGGHEVHQRIEALLATVRTRSEGRT